MLAAGGLAGCSSAGGERAVFAVFAPSDGRPAAWQHASASMPLTGLLPDPLASDTQRAGGGLVTPATPYSGVEGEPGGQRLPWGHGHRPAGLLGNGEESRGCHTEQVGARLNCQSVASSLIGSSCRHYAALVQCFHHRFSHRSGIWLARNGHRADRPSLHHSRDRGGPGLHAASVTCPLLRRPSAGAGSLAGQEHQARVCACEASDAEAAGRSALSQVVLRGGRRDSRAADGRRVQPMSSCR